MGYGPIEPELEYEPWHADWEPRVLGLTLAMGAAGAWTLDMARAARETLPDYEHLSYYQIWYGALVKQLGERGLVTADELAARRSLHPPLELARILHAPDVPTVLARGAPTQRLATKGPGFALGQRVRAITGPAPHHTRLPRYARDKPAVIERIHGMHVFADANASGQGEQPQWLYTVVFSGTELWPDAEPGLTVSIDAWEPYLEAA
jgi:nitrile hydratase